MSRKGDIKARRLDEITKGAVTGETKTGPVRITFPTQGHGETVKQALESAPHTMPGLNGLKGGLSHPSASTLLQLIDTCTWQTLPCQQDHRPAADFTVGSLGPWHQVKPTLGQRPSLESTCHAGIKAPAAMVQSGGDCLSVKPLMLQPPAQPSAA